MKKKRTELLILISIVSLFFCFTEVATAQEVVGQSFACSWGIGGDGQFNHWIAGNGYLNVVGQDIVDTLNGILPNIIRQPDTIPNHDLTPPVHNFDPVSPGVFVPPFSINSVITPSGDIVLEPDQPPTFHIGPVDHGSIIIHLL